MSERLTELTALSHPPGVSEGARTSRTAWARPSSACSGCPGAHERRPSPAARSSGPAWSPSSGTASSYAGRLPASSTRPCASSSATWPSWTRVPPRPECPGSGEALGGRPRHLSRTALGQVAAGLCLGLVACLPLAAVADDCAVAVGVALLAGTSRTAAFLWTVVPVTTPPLASLRGFSCERPALPKHACSDRRAARAGHQCPTLRAPSARHGLLWDDPCGRAADAGVPHRWVTLRGGGPAPWHGHLHGRDAPSQDHPRPRPGHLRGPWCPHPHGEALICSLCNKGLKGPQDSLGKGLTSEVRRRRERKQINTMDRLI